ncbi:LOW QUALITY PROTEIN: hypothetical protein PHMEG_00014304 [Phytophthora megakarya]|uniref:Uncharacterized protein n=1 Tax=Phytophthora megakarya TaxID=4795 RepID=A0A225W450_9STRA|nr:LOW QUALITY PROTEIN: hypothetical protein PHMEG_00014304 [Phytophthora megakarya]
MATAYHKPAGWSLLKRALNIAGFNKEVRINGSHLSNRLGKHLFPMLIVLDVSVYRYQNFGVSSTTYGFHAYVVRSILKLPYYLPTAVYYDKGNGLGLESCEADANINRPPYLEHIRAPSVSPSRGPSGSIPNSCRVKDNPLCKPIAPPVTVTTWIAQVLRYAAALEPPLTMTIRGDFKPRYVGDISSDMRTQILPLVTMMLSCKWDRKPRAQVEFLYNLWRTALVIPTTNYLQIPVGCIPVGPRQTPAAMRIGVGHWIVVIRGNTEGPDPVIGQYELGYHDALPKCTNVGSQSLLAGGTNVLEVAVSGLSGHTTNSKLCAFQSHLRTYPTPQPENTE